MGWKTRLLAGLLGLVFLTSLAWPVSLLCFMYLALSFRPRHARKSASVPPQAPSSSVRRLVGFILILLGAVALLSGGTFSPVFFLLTGCFTLLWPSLANRLPSGVYPVDDSILLRSKYVPFVWYALAEAKAGPDQFPRAVSGFEGTLMVFTQTGKTYSVASCLALDRAEAEAKVLSRLRSNVSRGPAGAYLLPLDAKEAQAVLRLKLSRATRLVAELPESASRVEGILVMECNRGFVSRAAAHEVRGVGTRPMMPPGGARLERPPLVWEVMEAISKRTRWPEPDSFSNLLDSMAATRNEPLSARLVKLEDLDGSLYVNTLSGEKVHTSRPQVRAIVSIYS